MVYNDLLNRKERSGNYTRAISKAPQALPLNDLHYQESRDLFNKIFRRAELSNDQFLVLNARVVMDQSYSQIAKSLS